MGWRFQHKPALVRPGMDVLEKAFVKGIYAVLVLFLQPRLVPRQIEHRIEFLAHEAMTHDRDAFLGELGGEGMYFLKSGDQQLEPAQVPFCPANSAMAITLCRV